MTLCSTGCDQDAESPELKRIWIALESRFAIWFVTEWINVCGAHSCIAELEDDALAMIDPVISIGTATDGVVCTPIQ